MKLAIDHLVGLGHRHIVYVPSIQTGDERLGRHVRSETAYRTLAEKAGFPPVVIPCQPAVAGGRAAAAQLADVPEATAVVIGGEASAAGLVAELHRRGTRIPQDLSVLGLLVSEELVSGCDPPLTCVGTPAGELGRLGVQALLRGLAGEQPIEPILRSGPLVLGESTGPPRS